ncbi:MAG: lytic transglycosylase domain-containing protein [Betaproteobacteria bacterium]|jgi:soluble lytic murein transglycosylase-like protein|nr:lytic transglycosylase domain-containing protein [Betaproteobacteria bacterium]
MRSPVLLLAALACALACAPAARADLWGYIDADGKAHFATERLDERYQLFYKGPTNLDAPPPAPVVPPPALPPLEGTAATIFARVTNHPNVQRFAALIETEAKRHGLDPALVRAVVAVESAYEPAAVSAKGAVGLMQVIPATAERYGLTADRRASVEQKLKDPATNVRIGARHLSDLIERFGQDLRLALAAYNAGEGAVERYARAIPPFPETIQYVALVEQFRALYTPPPPPPPPLTRPERVTIPRVRGS